MDTGSDWGRFDYFEVNLVGNTMLLGPLNFDLDVALGHKALDRVGFDKVVAVAVVVGHTGLGGFCTLVLLAVHDDFVRNYSEDLNIQLAYFVDNFEDALISFDPLVASADLYQLGPWLVVVGNHSGNIAFVALHLHLQQPCQ
jgi:hypothetical protein